MISLTYLSRATRPMTEVDLEDILAVSRRLNGEADVTGLLLHTDHQFIQTLEGGTDEVWATMERIQVDERHHEIDITLVEEVEHRFFPEWTMGFHRVAAERLAALPGWSDFLEPDSRDYERVQHLGRAGVFHRLFRDALDA